MSPSCPSPPPPSPPPRLQSFFESYHTYGAYWEPGNKLSFFIDGVETFTLLNSSLAAACNAEGQCVGQRLIPVEPMYLILNVALSNSWTPVSANLTLPTAMLVDYVRVWQRPDAIDLGCDPADAPTAQYIACNSGNFTIALQQDLCIEGACPPLA